MPRHRPSLQDAFNARYAVSDNGCWIWTGEKAAGGYGTYQTEKVRLIDGTYQRKRVYAHRISWELHHGAIPEDRYVLHTCDNPICVNPDHLFIGTKADNSRDMVQKDRQSRGERRPKSRLTDDDVRAILASKSTGLTLAKVYGVSGQTINDIRRRKTWRHIDGIRSDNPKANQGHGTVTYTNFTIYDIGTIRRLLADGYEPKQVARFFQVTEDSIKNIRDGKTWSHVK